MSPTSHSIEKLSEEPIIVAKLFKEFNFREDAQYFLAELKSAFDAANEPFYYVCLIEDIQINFGDVVMALSMVTRGDLAVVSHPLMKAIYINAHSNLITMATKALGQTQYGGIDAAVVESVEAGLELARQRLASEELVKAS